jgi:hypothetical protein
MKHWTINYPKRHIENSNVKEERTEKRYKRIVRVFKHLKARCKPRQGMRFSSYLIESLVFSAPDGCFGDDIELSTKKVLGWLATTRDFTQMKCPNGITFLCGDKPDQFNETEIRELIAQIGYQLAG